MFKKHPKGLPVLFFTEMWERFGFYLMLGIFLLYMTDTQMNGLGWSTAKAADVYGTYLALVYLTPFLGGLLADRILGYRNAIFLGGVLMGLGYMGLAIPGTTFFWPSLLLIIAGNGFFKPNISTLVGNLYQDEKYQKLKDSGYNIFYMGINIGAFVCNFFAAYLRQNFGWGWAFFAAGVGMFIGVIWLLFGQKHVKEADVMKPEEEGDMPLSKILASVMLPMVAGGVIGWFIPDLLFDSPLFGSNSTDAFVFAVIPVGIFYFSLWVKAPERDKSPIAALLSIFGVVIVFWAVFHQNGAALTVWARDYTDREVPEFAKPVVEPLGFIETVNTDPREVPVVDAHGVPVADQTTGEVITEMGPHPYFNNLTTEEWPENGEDLTLVSTEIFQSVNPFFVVFLTPLVVGVWSFLRKRKKEPSTPGKIGIGLFISALSTVVMMGAVLASNNGMDKSSMFWLIGTYGVITVGELCLSPMGLSLVSKLAPARFASLLMGGWFVSTAFGNKLSGVLSGLWGSYDNKIYFFLVNFILLFVAALAIFAMLKWLKRVVREHTTGT